MCQTDSAWEWCRWIHLDTFCDFEWTSVSGGVEKIACDIPSHKIEFFGDYDRNECGIRLTSLAVGDRGNWQCEIEKYYLGFSRRYGEFVSSKVNLAVIEAPVTTTTTTTSPDVVVSTSSASVTNNNNTLVISQPAFNIATYSFFVHGGGEVQSLF